MGLDDETLAVAVMSHVDGLTQDEIAAALSLSRRTIGKRLKRFMEHTRARAGAAVRPRGAAADEAGDPGAEVVAASGERDERWR